MEIHKDCAFSDASRFSEVRRPDNTPILTIRPYTGTVVSENERGVVIGRSAAIML
jgi:hypothetical protein